MTLDITLITSDIPVPYDSSLDFMQDRVKKIIEGDSSKQAVWFLEHPSIYTAGTGSNESELLNPNTFPVFKTGRGGKFTYHGPGQRVVYLMLDIKELHLGKPDIKKFVKQLEDWLIISLKEIGLECYRNEHHIGIWTKTKTGEEKKIAAIGIRAKKWIAFHGIALNINPNIDHYLGIIPCGIADKGVTSIWQEGLQINTKDLDTILIKNFEKTFDCRINKREFF